VLQYHYSYVRPRADLPGRDTVGSAFGDLLSLVRSSPGLTLVAYSPLLSGAYVRSDRPLGPEFDHAGTPARLSALRAVAAETGATVNQVVLAWLMGGSGAGPARMVAGCGRASAAGRVYDTARYIPLCLDLTLRHFGRRS
jgi:hypothetical protein